MTVPPSRLDRRLGTADAVVIGLGAMVGAGVFSAFGPAAAEAGSGLLPALFLAAAVAWANATSSAQLAVAHPESGGAYAWGRYRLGPGWGFLAGWAFVAGKLASCAAMALTLGAYAVPGFPRAAGVVAVVVLAALNVGGVHRTAAATRVLVAVVAASLAVAVGGAVAGGPGPSEGALRAGGVLPAAALLFFAFAGYARIAVLGEEVRDPRRTIPRAIPIALGLTLLIYAVVAAATLRALGAEALARTATPLADAAARGWPWAGVVVRAGAAAACTSVLLSLLAGLGRTVFAMAPAGDLPRPLAAVHPRTRVPHVAESALAAVVVVVVLLADLRGAIGWSSFCVLLYYGVAHLAALRLRAEERLWSRAWAVGGLVGCLAFAASLGPRTVASGFAVMVFGWLVRRLNSPICKGNTR